LYFVADTKLHGYVATQRGGYTCEEQDERGMLKSTGTCATDRMGTHPSRLGCGGRGDGDTTRDNGALQATGLCADGELGDAASQRIQDQTEREGGNNPRGAGTACAVNGFWADAEWLPCRDGKARPVEPGTFPLAYGVPNRVGRLRGYGNAIVPQVAAAFITAYLEVKDANENTAC
jgi:DNA (cytosine-5)-methyltransferase 1